MNWNRFPFRIFLRVFLVQFFVYNIIFGFLFFVFVPSSELGLKNLTLLVVGFLSVLTLSALGIAYHFVLPIHRMLLKTLRISSKKRFPEIPEIENVDLFEEEVGEYSDFERALDRIEKKIKRRKDQLQQERDEAQAFMSSVQEGLLCVTLEEKVLYFNSKFATLFMEPSQLHQEQLFLTEIFRWPEIYEAFKKVLNEKKTLKMSLKLVTKLENLPRDFLVSLTPLRNNRTQENYGVLGVFHDITDLKKIDEIRADFVENASHELRSPLTSIKGYVDTLSLDLKNSRTDQAVGFVDVISKNVNRMIDLVNDLLSLSRLESHPEIKLDRIFPLQITEHVVGEFNLLSQEKKVVLRVRGEVDHFEADAGKVEQVLRNLLGNAIKYIGSGNEVLVIWKKLPGGEVCLTVADNGPGIPEVHHSRLFERFYRVDRGRSRDQGGTGLGLAIVKHIMQIHGGNIFVQSELGKGSQFTCIFPGTGKIRLQDLRSGV